MTAPASATASTASRPSASRHRSRRTAAPWSSTVSVTALSWSVVALIVLLWWAVSISGVIPNNALPTPVAVAEAAWTLTQSGQLGSALVASLARVLIGTGFGIVTGLALGVLAGLSVIGQAVVDRPLQMIRMIPFNALVPLFILFLGIGEPMKVIVVAYAVAIPLYINTFAGIRDVDRRLVEVATVYRIPRAVIALQVLLRGALPQVLTGIRFSIGVAWIALVTVEVVNARDGLGFLLNQAQQFARTEIVIVVIVIYGILGGVTDWIVRLLERSLLSWRSAYTGS